ncbi:MAG: ABC transporter ATP-binding protein [Eubacteriales bacterium SKADARSKE-1]|nr:ABC transporter ATP-binding protein [Eubacteriales bacterium SKADARSKE-1]
MENLVIENLTKTYNKSLLIKDISMSVKENEIVSLLGVSGVGKTTIFNIVAGVDKPDSGKILLNGKDITNKPGYISYMPQNNLLLPYKNIIDNVSLPLIIRGERKEEARQKALPYFELFKLASAEKKYPHEISGGMKQRAALFRTYMYSKPIMLLDEPFCALDAITKLSMYEWFSKVSKELKLSVLFITHDIDEALVLSDKIYVISKFPGQIVDVLTPDKTKKEEFLLSSKFMQYKKQILENLRIL